MSRARRPVRLALSYIKLKARFSSNSAGPFEHHRSRDGGAMLLQGFDCRFGRWWARLLKLGPVLPAVVLMAGFLLGAPAFLFAEDAPAGAASGGEEFRRDSPEAGTGLRLGDGIVLRSVTGGITPGSGGRSAGWCCWPGLGWAWRRPSWS